MTAIIEKICSGLGNAGIVLIELKIQESLEDYEEFVAWFLGSFWEPLVNRLPQITADRRYIKLIALIHVRNPVPKKALDPIVAQQRSSSAPNCWICLWRNGNWKRSRPGCSSIPASLILALAGRRSKSKRRRR